MRVKPRVCKTGREEEWDLKLSDDVGKCVLCAFFLGYVKTCKWFFNVDLKCWTPKGCAKIVNEVPE